MRHWSIRLRLTVWYAASFIALLALFGVSIDALMRARLLTRIDTELDEEMDELTLELKLAKSRPEMLRQLQLRFFDHKSFEFQVHEPDGRVLFASRGFQHVRLPLPVPSKQVRFFQTAELRDFGPARISGDVSDHSGAPLLVYCAAPFSSHLAELNDLRLLMLTAGPLCIAVAVLGGYVMAWRSLRPVALMTDSARRITATDPAERLAVVNPHDELGRLAVTLNAMIDRLNAALSELRQFTTDAAHEFRTPLAVIRTTAELALHSPRPAEYYQESLSAIVDEVEGLARLSDQLLMLAREDAGLVTTPMLRFDLGSVMRGVASDLEALCEEKSVELQVDVADNVEILGEQVGIHRVFVNVLHNAIKQTPDGGSITMKLQVERDRAVASISDTGAGIAEVDLPHIFERFYRADPSRNRDSGGTGLGLAISRAIVTRHSGKISVASVLGSGTTLRIELPLAQQDAPALLR